MLLFKKLEDIIYQPIRTVKIYLDNEWITQELYDEYYKHWEIKHPLLDNKE